MKPYYERDGITIYHGDCRDVLPLLESDRVDLTLTDAPYNTSGSGGGNVYYGPGTNDARPWSEYATWLDAILQQSASITDGPVMCFVSKPGLLAISAIRQPWWIGAWLTSGAGNPAGPKQGVLIQGWWEPCLFYGSRYARKFCMGDTWTYATERQRNGHPCPKPVGLMRHIIRDTKANYVLDPFMGSGTTLRAAKDLGRRAIGIEIEERYCEIAAKRLAQGVLFAEGVA